MNSKHNFHQKVTLTASSLQTGTNFRSSIKELKQYSLQSDFLRKTSGTMLAKVIIGLLGAVSSILLARLLGPDARGTFGIALQLTTFGVQIGCLGLHSSNLYYSAKDSSRVPTIVGNSLILSLVLGIAVIFFMSLFFLVFPAIRPLDGTIFVLSLLAIPIGIVYLLVQNVLPGIQDIKSFNYSEIAFRSIGVILFIVVIILFNSSSIELVYSTTFVPPLLVSSWIVWKLWKFGSPKTSIPEIKNSISYASRVYISMIFAFVMFKGNLFIIKGMLGVTQAGYYAVVMNIADLFTLISASIGMILFSKSSSMENNRQRWKMTIKSAALCSGILLFTIGVFYWKDYFLVTLLFGKEFSEAVEPCKFLLPGIFFIGVQTIFMQYLASIGLPKFTLYLWGIGATFTVLLNYIFIQQYGLNGASVASSISYCVFTIAVFFYSLYYGRKEIVSI